MAGRRRARGLPWLLVVAGVAALVAWRWSSAPRAEAVEASHPSPALAGTVPVAPDGAALGSSPVAFHGAVLAGAGRPLEGARVELREGADGRGPALASARTDRDGRFAFWTPLARPTAVRVEAAGHAPLVCPVGPDHAHAALAAPLVLEATRQ